MAAASASSSTSNAERFTSLIRDTQEHNRFNLPQLKVIADLARAVLEEVVAGGKSWDERATAINGSRELAVIYEELGEVAKQQEMHLKSQELLESYVKEIEETGDWDGPFCCCYDDVALAYVKINHFKEAKKAFYQISDEWLPQKIKVAETIVRAYLDTGCKSDAIRFMNTFTESMVSKSELDLWEKIDFLLKISSIWDDLRSINEANLPLKIAKTLIKKAQDICDEGLKDVLVQTFADLVQSKIEKYISESRSSHYSISLDKDVAAMHDLKELAQIYETLGRQDKEKETLTQHELLEESYKKRALEVFNRKKTRMPSPIGSLGIKLFLIELYCNHSRDYFKINNPELAEKKLRHAEATFVELSMINCPKNNELCLARIKLGATYIAQGKIQEALPHLIEAEKLIDQLPYDAFVYCYQIAALYLAVYKKANEDGKEGFLKKKNELSDKAARLKKRPCRGFSGYYAHKEPSICYKDIAILCLELEMGNEAEKFLKESASGSLNPQQKVVLLIEHSLAYFHIGRIQKVKSLLQQAEKLATHRLKFCYASSIAALHIKIGNLKKAEDLLWSSGRTYRDEGVISFLIDAYKNAGDEEAEERIKHMEISPDSEAIIVPNSNVYVEGFR